MTYPMINGVITLESIAAEERRLAAPGVRLRVESAGTYPETRVLAVEEDGTEHYLGLVESVEITIGGTKPNRARITFVNVEVDVTAEPAKVAQEITAEMLAATMERALRGPGGD